MGPVLVRHIIFHSECKCIGNKYGLSGRYRVEGKCIIRYDNIRIGLASRLDTIQAAILNVKFPHLDRWSEMRQANAERYAEMFTAAGLDRIVTLPVCGPRRRHVC